VGGGIAYYRIAANLPSRKDQKMPDFKSFYDAIENRLHKIQIVFLAIKSIPFAVTWQWTAISETGITGEIKGER
jgi:hypothetical protein